MRRFVTLTAMAEAHAALADLEHAMRLRVSAGGQSPPASRFGKNLNDIKRSERHPPPW